MSASGKMFLMQGRFFLPLAHKFKNVFAFPTSPSAAR